MDQLMRTKALRAFRTGSIVAATFSLLVTPTVLVWSWVILLLFVLIFVFFSWAAVLINNAGAGTPYRFLRSSELMELGLTSRFRAGKGALIAIVVIAAVLGHWLKWPNWWVPLYKANILAGPASAIFLFAAASIYQTCLWLVERGAVKRCSNDHEFSPFERSCPYCSARKELDLVFNQQPA